MRLQALIDGLDVRAAPASTTAPLAPDWGDARVCDLTEDSRTIMPGSLFVARRGGKNDGRQFAASAVAQGAIAVLTDDPELALPPGSGAIKLLAGANMRLERLAAEFAERFYGEPTSRLAVVGVTGTNGKTTTTFLIHQLLNAAAHRCGLIGTVQIDDGSEVAPAILTTPPAMELSRTFARMLECGCKAAAIEASSHALDQDRVAAVRFRVGIFTNLTQDHLDYHGTMDRYAEAKARLFTALPADGTAIVNGSDPWCERMLRDCRARVWRCAVRHAAEPISPAFESAQCRAVIRAMGPWGLDVEITGPWTNSSGGVAAAWSLRLPLPGEHNAMNALQAAAAAVVLGLPPEVVARGLAMVSAPPGRLQPVPLPAPLTGPVVYVDYAHTDDALERTLLACRQMLTAASTGRLHCVFGCGGDRDRTKRPKMGRAAATLADAVIITSDNPRTEQPSAIITDILAGVPAAHAGKITVHPDRERAIHEAIAAADPHDLILIAGKGHETYQILPDGRGGTITRDFDDRAVAAAALARRIPSVQAVAADRPGAGVGAAAGRAASRGRGQSS
jgi:UDP-N-acetylmuramoyl-L-alanyl-D-glutamate--2,6-diaminopimelate ligase